MEIYSVPNVKAAHRNVPQGEFTLHNSKQPDLGHLYLGSRTLTNPVKSYSKFPYFLKT